MSDQKRRLEIRDAGGVDQSVHLDGQDITKTIRAYRIEGRPGVPPEVTFDVLVLELDHSAGARIHLDERSKVLLELLGWTPPRDPEPA